MADTRIKIVGLEEYAARLQSLPPAISGKLLGRVSAAGSSYLRSLLRKKAPVASKPHNRRKGQTVAPGTLQRAVYSLRVREQSNRDQQVYIVSVRKGRREQAKNRDAFYWTWVEFGHVPVRRGSGKNPGRGLAIRRRDAKSAVSAGTSGKVGQREFMGPTMRDGGQTALKRMESRLSVEWNKYLLGKGGYRQK